MKTSIIIKPNITEKSILDVGKNIYTFIVNLKAEKKRIVEEISKIYKVKVINISTVIRKGKLKRTGKQRKMVKAPTVKIARVKLEKGQKIDIFHTTQGKE
jgi:large subunit ribosomal protein L23